MSRFSPTVAPNSGEAFGRALQQSVSAYLGARQQKQQDEAEMFSKGFVPVDLSNPIKGPHTPPIVAPQTPAIDAGALNSLIAKMHPDASSAPADGQAFGSMLSAQAMPLRVTPSQLPIGVAPEALAKASGADRYGPAAPPTPVHLYGRDWQMTPEKLAALQQSQAMQRADLESKLAGTAKTYRDISKLQLGDPGYAGAMGQVAGAEAGARVPAAVEEARQKAPIATQQAINEARGKMPIAIQQAGGIANAELPAKLAVAAAGAGNSTAVLNRTLSLQQHFNNDQTFKDAQQIATAFQKIKAAAATGNHTPGSDMSLIYGLMKLQDPGSTVREGEYASAANAASIPARIRDAYNLTLRNNLLPPETRADFLKQAEAIARAQQSVFNGTKTRYADQATRAGLNPADIVFDPYEGLFGADPAQPGHVQTIDEMIRAGKSDEQIRAALGGRKP